MISNNKCKRIEVAIVIGSDNVFADLGLPNAEQLLAKAKLAVQIERLIKSASWNQAQVAKKLGVDRSRISALLRGRFTTFSAEELTSLFNQLRLPRRNDARAVFTPS